MAQKTKKRADEIMRLLLHEGKTSVEQLMHHFKTSSASVRRDLARLEQQGLVHRTRGGAMLTNQVYEPFRFDASFVEREGRFQQEKKHIGRRTAALLQDGEMIGITSGTTTTHLAHALRGRKGLQVLTNAANIALDLSASDGPKTVLTGGCIMWPGAFSLTGTATIETIERFVLDRVVVGVTGIHVQHGATMIEADEAAVSRAFVQHAREVIVVADSSKVGITGRAVICGLQRISTLVTDSGIRDEDLAELRHAGLRVIIADEK